MKLFLAEPFASLWRDKDPFEEAFAIDGETYRDMGDRHTSRFESEGKAYFVKTHSGVGWQEIIKNLLCGRLPVLGAGNEWHAIERLHSLGVETMTAAAFGQQGWNPAAQRSFLVTEALEPAEELDSYCTPAVLSAMGPRERRALVKKLAAISRALHDHGINHRDYYLCHFLLDTAAQYAETPISQRPIYLIDLHRVQIRKRTPRRWRKKDLAGLYYSARRAGFDHRDMLCFLRYYKQQPLRQVMSEGRKLWRAIAREADHLHAKGIRKGYHG